MTAVWVILVWVMLSLMVATIWAAIRSGDHDDDDLSPDVEPFVQSPES